MVAIGSGILRNESSYKCQEAAANGAPRLQQVKEEQP
jgi:hypothetical protein